MDSVKIIISVIGLSITLAGLAGTSAVLAYQTRQNTAAVETLNASLVRAMGMACEANGITQDACPY